MSKKKLKKRIKELEMVVDEMIEAIEVNSAFIANHEMRLNDKESSLH